jgi:hypothetical protein
MMIVLGHVVESTSAVAFPLRTHGHVVRAGNLRKAQLRRGWGVARLADRRRTGQPFLDNDLSSLDFCSFFVQLRLQPIALVKDQLVQPCLGQALGCICDACA